MPENSDPPRTTILVADDNEGNRKLAESALEDEGYRVIVVDGGAAAIAAFEREAPDCVVLDVRMPNVDGLLACARIRALPGGADTPILFLTALRDIDTFDQALKAGGDDFLTKPVRPAELVARVETAVRMRRMGETLREHYELLKHQREDMLRLQLQKERLMSFVVHDLKNPVNAMDLHAQLILRDRELPERARDSAAQIRREARQLNRMILNLLDVSKGDEGKLVARRSEVDLKALLVEVFVEAEMAAQARQVHLQSSLEVERLRADEDLLRRTLSNLVENAIRHAPPDSAVTVEATLLPEGVGLRVTDAGRGIPEDMMAKIFDPFVQVEGSALHGTSRAGRGLGLAFCKLAVEAHGGSIWVEDALPGAIFCVRIPHDS
jgi:two-component system sensor histidine kinase/response regulator